MIDPRKLSPEDIRKVAGRLRRHGLGPLLDSTLLSPQATGAQIDALVDEAVELGANVCVNGSRIERAVARLATHKGARERGVLVVGVVAFPLGACTTKIKMADTKHCLELGADEVDMVANAGLLKDGDSDGYRDDIDSVAAAVAEFNAAHGAARGLKVIVETCYLTDDEKESAAGTVAEIGLRRRIPVFVKSSTGFARPPEGIPSGATIDDVLLIRRTVGRYHTEKNPVGVKAAGGIRDAAAVINFVIAAGGIDKDLEPVSNLHRAVRIGTSSAAAIVSDFNDIYSEE